MKKYEYKVVGESTVKAFNELQRKLNPKGGHKNIGFVEIFNMAATEGWRLTGVNIGKASNFVMEREIEEILLDDDKTQPI